MVMDVPLTLIRHGVQHEGGFLDAGRGRIDPVGGGQIQRISL